LANTGITSSSMATLHSEDDIVAAVTGSSLDNPVTQTSTDDSTSQNPVHAFHEIGRSNCPRTWRQHITQQPRILWRPPARLLLLFQTTGLWRHTTNTSRLNKAD